MKTRGEKQYVNMPLFAARLYDKLTNNRGVNNSLTKISKIIGGTLREGQLLDVGTGPGRLLPEIKNQIPQLELHGLDISAAMIKIARKKLGTYVDLRVGNIVKTDYPDNFFDCVVSSGSFYNWDNPVEGVNEIFRVLKPGRTAFVFETTTDYDPDMVRINLQNNLQDSGLIRRILSPLFLKKQLRMTYSLSEFEEILMHSEFKNSFKIERDVLGNLPVYVRIELNK